jgi:prolyl-tRNA synthetase
MFLYTNKEVPADAEILSHELMIRAGMIQKLASGIYNHLPLFQRIIKKIKKIIHEEMDRIDAQEVSLPFVLPASLWQETKRWSYYGKELLRFKDRHERDFCLGPTHEEIITDLVRREVNSYRQLPLILYQIQTKFRDEIRPRFGVMRAREFIMKDAYSFDIDEVSAEESYNNMYNAYFRIFNRCGLEFRAVEADTGSIGGSFSHEFMVLADNGEDLIVSCNKCNYSANIEKAEIKPKENKNSFSEFKERKLVSTPGQKKVEEVAKFLNVSPENIVKTLILGTEDKQVAAILRGDHELNIAKLKNVIDCNFLELSEEETIKKLTGAPQGFTGPIDLKIEIYADNEVKNMVNFVTGGNIGDAHFININTGRDFEVLKFADIRNAQTGDPCPRCSGTLSKSRGIEVGHIFKLGTKYTEDLNATYLDKNGKRRSIVMGCYGIGIERIIASAIEQYHDEHGIIFPFSIAPFHFIILPVNMEKKEIRMAAEKIYEECLSQNLEVMMDDRKSTAGVKFKDADLIGIPYRVTVGIKSLREGKVEIKERKTGKTKQVNLDNILNRLLEIKNSFKL